MALKLPKKNFDLSAEAMVEIQKDAMLNVPVEKSSVVYTDEMKRYRKHFEEWSAALPEGATIDIPFLE
jgi:hypothetical protein